MMSCTEEDITAVVQMKKEFDSAFKSRVGQNMSRFKNESRFSSSSESSMYTQQLHEKQQKEKYRQLEVIEAKAVVVKLRNDLSSLQAKHNEMCIQHEQAISEVNQKYEANKRALVRVKEQLEKLLSEDEQLRESLHNTQALLTRTTAENEQKLFNLQKQKNKLEMDLTELEHESHAKQQELRNDNLRKESELKICQLELKEAKDQLAETMKRYSTTFAQLQEAEQARLKGTQAEQRVKELEMKLSQLETERTVTRTMKDQLDRLKSLEAENHRLRNENLYCKETQDNVFLLREENNSLKKQLERAEQKCVDLVMLQTENKQLKDELKEWRNIKDGNTNRSLSPKELTRRLVDLQRSNATLLDRQGLLQTSMHRLEAKLKMKESEFETLQCQYSQMQIQSKEAEQLITRLKRKLLLVSKERDSNKSMLELYEETSANKPAINQRNIKQLQDTLRSYQNHATNVETELEQKTKELTIAVSKIRALEAEVNSLKANKQPASQEADSKVIGQLREQVLMLEKTMEELQIENDDLKLKLERAHMQGVYEPEKTKIITMTINPFSTARKRRHEEIEQIAEENKRLKTRLQVIEENKSDLEDITQKVSLKLQESGVDSQQIKEFQEQIRSAELKNQRLMEVFKQKSQELREVFCCLLGYMIQLPCEKRYKLRSIYAESPDDALIFQKAENGELQLLETPYSTTLTEKMELYLNNGHSIPAFLSSLTMDLFNQQTMLE